MTTVLTILKCRMLVTIRDQGLPLPAGGILISPWVDLTHSFPSIVTDNPGDYLPPGGFRYKPSPAWPPPNADEIAAVEKEGGSDHENVPDNVKKVVPQSNDQDAVYGYSVHHDSSTPGENHHPGEQGASDQTENAKQESVTVNLDGKMVEIKDQIQMYATNQLLTHPLVSPVLQPSLGGLPPLFVLVGGAEMLRDEQFYLAHKAANPKAYAPSDAFLDEHDPNRELLNKYQPTYVQLQVWEGLCHVAPTLSFTRPAKFMYRAIAQFGAYALARAQNSEIEILDDEAVSPIPSDDAADPTMPAGYGRADTQFERLSVGKAGDPLPAFHKHMIRQRVDNNGTTHPLDPPSAYEVLQIPSSAVGAINPQLVKRWIEGKREWDEKFAKEKRRMQQQRIKELSHGLRDFNGESPPPSSLAARRAAPGVLPAKGKKNYPLFLWSLMASTHDKRTIGREAKAEGSRRRSVDAGKTGSTSDNRVLDPKEQDISNEGTSSEKDTTEAGQGHRDTPSEGRDFARSIDKPMSPLLILPDDDVKQSIEENASTRALYHARGTLPTTSEVSLAQSARPASWTVRSRSDDVSTVGDKDSATVTSTGLGSPDNASTRAVLGAGGVVGLVQRDRPGTSNSESNSQSIRPTSSTVHSQSQYN